jgi:alkyldihydroxyacetonephosphate synthase
MPASVRLVDNLQFQFGRALKPDSGSSFASALQKFYVSKVKGIDLEQMVACTLVFEGEHQEQKDLIKRVDRLAKSYGGFGAGGAAGKDGYNLTFGIAYIRDFLLEYWTLGDSFETAVPWGKVNDVIEQTRAAVILAHKEQGLAGHPFVTARVSQIYPTGCCVYFYIGFHYKGCSEPIAAFKHIEHEARVAILNAGGALSHHHGIGKLRAPYLRRIKSEAALKWAERVAETLDPTGTFASGNQRPGP